MSFYGQSDIRKHGLEASQASSGPKMNLVDELTNR